MFKVAALELSFEIGGIIFWVGDEKQAFVREIALIRERTPIDDPYRFLFVGYITQSKTSHGIQRESNSPAGLYYSPLMTDFIVARQQSDTRSPESLSGFYAACQPPGTHSPGSLSGYQRSQPSYAYYNSSEKPFQYSKHKKFSPLTQTVLLYRRHPP